MVKQNHSINKKWLMYFGYRLYSRFFLDKYVKLVLEIFVFGEYKIILEIPVLDESKKLLEASILANVKTC